MQEFYTYTHRASVFCDSIVCDLLAITSQILKRRYYTVHTKYNAFISTLIGNPYTLQNKQYYIPTSLT